MNPSRRMIVPTSGRAFSTALLSSNRRTPLANTPKIFFRGAAVSRGIFPIHKLPPLSFLRHQSIPPKTAEIEDTKPQIRPRYKIIYTCGVCQKRSEETFSKQSYHHGTVIIRCEGCRNLHLIADHLHIISETKVELEDILQGKVQIRRGVYLEDRGTVVEFGEPESDQPEEALALEEPEKKD